MFYKHITKSLCYGADDNEIFVCRLLNFKVQQVHQPSSSGQRVLSRNFFVSGSEEWTFECMTHAFLALNG